MRRHYFDNQTNSPALQIYNICHNVNYRKEVKRTTSRPSRPRIVRQLRGGQVTIPADYRRRLGITDDSLLQMSVGAGELRIKPVRVTDQAGSDWVKELYDLFVPVRLQATRITDQEVNAAVDEAVQAVRKVHG